MPGVHTFYDGSTMLQPVADAVGVECDKLNLVLCMLASIPFAIAYRTVLAPGKASERTRTLYPLIIGLTMCYFCYGRAIKHLLGNALISYAIMYFAPAKHVHQLVFVFTMSYLTFIHFYRWMVLDTYSIDVTGAMMVSVQKITTLAFSLHDGKARKKEELNELQDREAIREMPSLLAYLSYIVQFQTVLTGPLCFFTDWMNLVRGTHVQADKNGKMPSPSGESWRKLTLAFFLLALVILFAPKLYPERIAEPELMALRWPEWSAWFFLAILMQRIQYYFAWTFADAVCNFSGFGFAGFDAAGEAQWNLCTNVNIYKVEMGQSFKEVLDNWNITTMGWLRRVAFDRVPKKYRTLSTYFLSAWWHGLFLGYYITFLGGAIVTLAGKAFRRSLRWRFLGSPAKKTFYDVITFIGTKVTLAYVTYPFVTMHLYPGWGVYKETYFFVHVGAILCATCLPVILPPPKTVKADVNGNNGTAVADSKTKKDL